MIPMHVPLNRRNIVVLSFLCLLILFPWQMAQGAEEIPTIEELTGGKIKTGDLITKENVDLVKDWQAPSNYEKVKRGQVQIIAPTTPREATTPPLFAKVTEKNKGQAVIGEGRAVYTKDGKKWPGGLPFPAPETGDKVLANYRHSGLSYKSDDFDFYVLMQFTNKEGKQYKENLSYYRKLYTNCRIFVPPLGSVPNHEEEIYRGLIYFLKPHEIKGLSQLVIRYYDDSAKADDGFVFIPALRRTRRISASNWQDNMAGSDINWGDGDGLTEPFANWNFKLLEKRVIIYPGMSNPKPSLNPDGSADIPITWDEGTKFERYQWELRPVYVVECLPKEDHVYSKRIGYFDAYTAQCNTMINFDRQGKMWRGWSSGCTHTDGVNVPVTSFPSQYDFQIDHITRLTTFDPKFNEGAQVQSYTLKNMLRMGK